MSKTYAIFDWAGNELTKHGEFTDFEEAWGCIRENFNEEDFDEYQVLETE